MQQKAVNEQLRLCKRTDSVRYTEQNLDFSIRTLNKNGDVYHPVGDDISKYCFGVNWRRSNICTRTNLRLVVACCIITIIVYHVSNPGKSDDNRVPFFTSTPTVVQTRLGPVHGACTDGICRWRNIPFSEPFARFERSSPRISSYGEEVGSGTQNGPACFQFVDPLISGMDVGTQSEDCLNLNIFAPAKTAPSRSRLPVMVFVHGGGFLVGSAGPGDGSSLASHGVVVVVIQYRLGIFGFLQQSDATGGANGIGDQITALQWIRQHIHAFGGDSGNVTIFGESSGSVSVCLLSHLPLARGLFRNVIAESGVCYPSGDVLMTATEATHARNLFIHRTNIAPDDLLTMEASDLRDRTVQTFDPMTQFTPLFVSGVGQPSVDGDVLPTVPTKLTPLAVDLLTGYNSGEVTLHPPNGIPGGAAKFFSQYLGRRAGGILNRYEHPVNESDIIADACMRCPSVRYAQRVAQTAAAAVYFYVYDNPHQNSPHGAELPAVFGIGPTIRIGMEGMSLTTSRALSERTQRIWTDFAKGVRRGGSISVEQVGVSVNGTFIRAMLIGETATDVVNISTVVCDAWERAEDAVGGFVTARMCNMLMV